MIHARTSKFDSFLLRIGRSYVSIKAAISSRFFCLYSYFKAALEALVAFISFAFFAALDALTALVILAAMFFASICRAHKKMSITMKFREINDLHENRQMPYGATNSTLPKDELGTNVWKAPLVIVAWNVAGCSFSQVIITSACSVDLGFGS